MFTQSKVRQTRLLLEYNRSGQAGFCIIEWGYSVAHCFSGETNWYISTIAITDYWCSIHGLFFTIDGVSFFTDGHNDFSFIIVDGYSTCIVIKIYISVERFSQRTDRNHSSPVAVYVWSSIANNDFIVNNIVGRTDGHNNGLILVRIFLTYSVFKSTSIDSSTSLNSYYDIHGSFFVRVNSQSALTIAYITSFNVDVCIFIALICNISTHSTTNLTNVAICINSRNSYFVFLVGRAIVVVKFKAVSVVRIYNSQFSFNKLFVFFAECLYFNNSTQQRIISWLILISQERAIMFTVEEPSVYNSVAIEAIFYVSSIDLDTVFVNILAIYIYILTKHNFISYSLRIIIWSRG